MQGIASARAAIGGDPDIATDKHPSVMAALAARDKAAWNLAQTTVRAPADGVISQSTAFKAGQYVTAGTPLFSLVETGDTWVEANFKETQLTHMKVGQEAEIVLDTYPGPSVQGGRRQHRRRHRLRVLAAAGAERHRQLGQGHAAHSGAPEGRGCRRRRWRCAPA